MCSKAGCSSEHCFVHPEHSEHFSLGHNHFAVWAAAWNKDENLADLETPPNHHKFNMAPGHKTADISPLLQHQLADRNQPTNNASPVINFNISPELLAVFHPAPAQAAIEHGVPPPAVHDPQSLVQSGMQHGPNLTLDAFCTMYGLSQDIRTKLHDNGYTGSDTLTFIIVPELKEMGFKYGEIAALKAAMRQWCQ
ncbi:hypothetical protein EDB19DRAFT_1647862 [Suillus lakei]|nr:hypothetical protein EDB19DRAFT_1647862 [Suillus lakei]